MIETKEYELGDLLIYEQPTEYIVESTEYDDSYQTPVLTAGKSFIIGYTNETKGIYNNFPVIIFDDFTTSSQYVNFPFKVKSSAMKILSPNKELSNLKYLYYLMQTINFNAENHKRYWISEYSKLKINLPTLEEQQRIVNRIETLFAKLDQAKEKAQNVVDTFETRKASILHKAFNNQLKIDNGKLKDEDWVGTTIGETVKLLSGQDFKPEDYNDSENGIPYITGASNFDNNHVIINRWTEKPTVIARKNDVLLVCKGSGYGKTIIADFEEAHIARQIMSLRPNDKVNNKFIQYYLQNNYEYLRNGGQGLIPGISRNIVLEMPIKLPPINYQLSIVNFLDTILEKENQAKEAAETVLEQIDLLKKSILARAFRGEL